MQRKKFLGFTLIELLVVISIIALLIGILLPALGAARRTARQMQNSTQLRGIHQGFVIFAQSNKSGGGEGYYPGLKSNGKVARTATDDITSTSINAAAGADVPAPTAADTSAPGNGALFGTGTGNDSAAAFITYAFASLVKADVITGSPAYFINPGDTVKTAFVPGSTDAGTVAAPGTGRFGANKVSYTILDISDPDYPGEWKETTNTAAIVLGDRCVDSGTTTTSYSSVWTDKSSGDWRGTLTRNDGSSGFETSTKFTNAGFKYGRKVFVNGSVDNIFGARILAASTTQLVTTQGVLWDSGELNESNVSF